MERRGKQLALLGEGPDGATRAVVVQLGMSGRLVTAGPGEARQAHTHIEWHLEGGIRLRFIDPRRFGAVSIAPDSASLAARWATLGPDALTVRAPALAGLLSARRTPIKAALLDQRIIAGVGNIYADEALHVAGIHPRRPAGAINTADVSRLANAIRTVLRRAIRAGGSTLRDYTDGSGAAGKYQSRHAVYGRGGTPCLRCGETLRAEQVAQRKTVWCPVCQDDINTARC